MAIQKRVSDHLDSGAGMSRGSKSNVAATAMDRIKGVRRRLAMTASDRANGAISSSGELLAETMEMLHATVEELHVTNEMLSDKNDELAEIYLSIAEERQHYKDLFDFAPDGYLITTMDGMIKQANRSASMLFNVRVENLIGKPMVLFIEDRERREFCTRLSRLYQIPWKLEWKQSLQPRDRAPFSGLLVVGTDDRADDRPISLRWMVRERPSAAGETKSASAPPDRPGTIPS